MSINNDKSARFQGPDRCEKRAVILAPFFSEKALASRPFTVSAVLSRFMAVDIVTTNFDHQAKGLKEKFQFGDNRTIYYLNTVQYRSNVSIKRFLSHFIFSLKAGWFFIKRKKKYDLVYVTLPLNLTALIVFLFSRRQIKIADVVDIWPDVLPFPRSVKLALAPAFMAWRKCFQFSVSKSDALMAVSDYFLDQSLKFFSKHTRFSRRFYIGHRLLPVDKGSKGSKLKIAYVGNIGRLYDFNTLVEALSLSGIRNKYQLHIIGDGDRRKWLLEALEKRFVKYTYYGIVYDERAVGKILSACHIGFNGYINTTAAFSYKALTYLSAGLPIINSMRGDLRAAVSKFGIGFNYTAGNVHALAGCLFELDQSALSRMSESSCEFFKKELDLDAIMADIEAFIRSVTRSVTMNSTSFD